MANRPFLYLQRMVYSYDLCYINKNGGPLFDICHNEDKSLENKNTIFKSYEISIGTCATKALSQSLAKGVLCLKSNWSI